MNCIPGPGEALFIEKAGVSMFWKVFTIISRILLLVLAVWGVFMLVRYLREGRNGYIEIYNNELYEELFE